jgi:hypothetical protein
MPVTNYQSTQRRIPEYCNPTKDPLLSLLSDMVTGYCEKHAGHVHKVHGQNADFLTLEKLVYITFSLIPLTKVVNYSRYCIAVHSVARAAQS